LGYDITINLRRHTVHQN